MPRLHLTVLILLVAATLQSESRVNLEPRAGISLLMFIGIRHLSAPVVYDRQEVQRTASGT
jgi:hypothetical protein